MPPSPSGPPLDPLTVGAVVVAVTAVSSSAPLIAFATAPALAIAFWRNALATGVVAPWASVRRRAEFRVVVSASGRREGWYCVLSGVALALHFATWMPSAQLTSVAAATALVATQPVWQGVIARWQGRRLPGTVWVGIGITVLGAALASGADFTVSGRAFAGDLLAIAGAVFAAGYTALGERARATLSTATYTTICYSVCSLLLLVVCLVGGVPLGGYDADTWLVILALVAGAQLLGHSMFNYALRRVSATTVSVLILLEVPGAALIGWLWLGQLPSPSALPGLGVLLVGTVVVIVGGARTGRRRAPAPLPGEAGPPPV